MSELLRVYRIYSIKRLRASNDGPSCPWFYKYGTPSNNRFSLTYKFFKSQGTFLAMNFRFRSKIIHIYISMWWYISFAFTSYPCNVSANPWLCPVELYYWYKCSLANPRMTLTLNSKKIETIPEFWTELTEFWSQHGGWHAGQFAGYPSPLHDKTRNLLQNT